MLDFSERYKWLSISALLAATPLATMAILVLNGIGFDQMIMFFGLVVNEQSITLLAIIIMGCSTACFMSLLVIIALKMEEFLLRAIDRQIKKHPDRKEYYEKLKKIVE